MIKNAMAARVAAELEKEDGVTVERIKGGLGELRVEIDGVTAFDSNRLWYPSPKTVMAAVRERLQKPTA